MRKEKSLMAWIGVGQKKEKKIRGKCGNTEKRTGEKGQTIRQTV